MLRARLRQRGMAIIYLLGGTTESRCSFTSLFVLAETV
jgi:hypothetical protein